MYEQFYGLTEKPFSLTPNPRFVFQSEQYRAAEEALLYGIAQKEGFMLVTGAPGTGKTTLCRDLLEKLDPEKFRVALLFNPFLNGVEMLQALLSEFGIDWSTVGLRPASFSPGAGTVGSNAQFTIPAGGGTTITAVITALQSQGTVKVLSSPRVSALNNQRAVFDVTTGEIVFVQTTQQVLQPGGTAIPVTTVTPTQVNVGIVLDVLPQIGADNSVTMNIRPVVTSVARTATFVSQGTTYQAPVVDTRESDTMARLRGGETIIIGGLMQNRHETIHSGVPVLQSIPLLGRLFRRSVELERKSELVIFLTPTIIAGQPPAGR